MLLWSSRFKCDSTEGGLAVPVCVYNQCHHRYLFLCAYIRGVFRYAYVAAGACLHWICAAAHLSFLLSLRPNFRPLQALVSTF